MSLNRMSPTVVAIAIGAAFLAGDAAAGAPRFALDLDGASAGWLHTVQGATAEAVVANQLPMKQVADAKKPELSVEVDGAMSDRMASWLRSSFEHKHARKDGSIHVVDTEAKVASSLEFTGGLLTEADFPAIEDGGGQAARKMTIKISPETTRLIKGDGKKIGGAAQKASEQGKPVPSKFRFDFAGCGVPCTHATSLAPVRFKLDKETLTVTGLRVRVSAGPTVDDWAKKKDAREGTLAYLAGDGSVFIAFKLHGLKPTHASPTTTSGGPAVDLDLSVTAAETTP